MNMTNDTQLLRDFAEHGSEPAFRQLVERHLPLVLGTARRTTGDPSLADEISQTVFILLARKAGRLRREVRLSGWLHNTTVFVARRAQRGDRRRKFREQEVVAMNAVETSGPGWDKVRPELDGALSRLGKTDRDALFLRYLEEKPLREVGDTLGLTEDAARKRVTRALDKLRRILSRRGTNISIGVLTAGLGAEAGAASTAVAGSSAALTASIVSSGLSVANGTAVTSALLTEVIAAMKWAKIKWGAALAVGTVSVALLLPQVVPDNDPVAYQPEMDGSTTVVQSPDSPTGGTPAGSSMALPSVPDSFELNGETIALKSLEITVLDAATDQPIQGVEMFHSAMMVPGMNQPPRFVTDADGRVKMTVPDHLPGDERMSKFQVFFNADGYAGRELMFLSSTGEVFSTVGPEYTVRLERGMSLSGTVVDHAGNPMRRVVVSGSGNNYLGYSMSYDSTGKMTSDPVVRVDNISQISLSENIRDPKAVYTDKNGRFTIPNFPSDLDRLMLGLIDRNGNHARFITPEGKSLTAEELPQISIESLRNGTARLVFPSQLFVAGTVSDTGGQPVIGADVVVGVTVGNLKILARTNSDYAGRFRMTVAEEREYIVTASSPGHAATSVETWIAEGGAPVKLVMPDAVPLKLLVEDSSWRPISGAKISVVDWQIEGQALEWNGVTDIDGRAVWPGAPTNQVMLMFEAAGFAPKAARIDSGSRTNVVILRAGDGNQVFITGNVTDARTSEPVPYFTVELFRDSPSQSGGAPFLVVAGTDGFFNTSAHATNSTISSMPAWTLVTRADGYDPYESREYTIYEGDQNLKIEMEPGGIIAGRILTPDGNLAEGAEIAASSPSFSVFWRSTDLRREKSVKAGADGRFEMTKPTVALGLVVFHPDGWSVQPMPEKTSDLTIRLKPYATIQGQLLLDGIPASADEEIAQEFQNDYRDLGLYVWTTTKTDSDGRFILEKLPGGTYLVSHRSREWRRGGQPTVNALETPVTVSEGQTAEVLLGAGGQSVSVGFQSVLKGQTTPTVDLMAILRRDVDAPKFGQFKYNSRTRRAQAREAFDARPDVRAAKLNERNHISLVDESGQASFDGVLPGDYVLELKLYPGKSLDHVPGHSETIEPKTLLTSKVVIPDTASDEQSSALSLGELAVGK